MYEVDFLPVGDAGRSGDAIAMRFTRPDSGGTAVVIVDAGFQDDGDALVEHVQEYYGTRRVHLAVLTHPDGDHIGGMGTVLRDLDVGVLAVHRLSERGGQGLPAADAVNELIAVAEQQGTAIHEPFAGDGAFGDALRILGPDPEWYGQLVAEQQGERAAPPRRGAPALLEAARRLGQRFVAALPLEIRFDDGPGTNPRNNTSVVMMLEVEGDRLLITADAGVPALNRAWDWLEENGQNAEPPSFVQIPHHGSRRNGSTELFDRLFGPTGQPQSRTAFVNVTVEAVKHPSPRIANAYMRRGYRVFQTHGTKIWHHTHDAPPRNWGPAPELGPMEEWED